MRLRTLLVGVMAVWLVLGIEAHAADAVVVIVHPDNSAQQLSIQEIRRIYRGRQQVWPDGQRIDPVDLKHDDPARALFCNLVFEQDIASVERGYLKRVLSGKGQPPRQLDAEETIDYIASHPEAIGYVDPALVTDRVKSVPIK